MRAAMWWIDRWRQSDAFARMTAEEQGLFRNLCDEVVLRESGVIPDDERILAKASGDHEAWARSGKSVLKSMKKVPGGWTNETAIEVKAESERRSKKQKEFRDRRRNDSGNDPGNASGNGADNETLPPYPEQDKEKEREKELMWEIEIEEKSLFGILLGLQNSGEDVQAVCDSLDRPKGQAAFNAHRALISGRSGIPPTEKGLTVRRRLIDALESRQRAQGKPYLSENSRKSMEAINRVTGMIKNDSRTDPDWARALEGSLSEPEV